jgi:hypothetical protein
MSFLKKIDQGLFRLVEQRTEDMALSVRHACQTFRRCPDRAAEIST